MELGEKLKQHRVKHIISSYQLEGDESEPFNYYLDDLLKTYPASLLELALVEVLIDGWLRIPMQKGCQFLVRTHRKLREWEACAIASTVDPEQFQQITGLDPNPIFRPLGKVEWQLGK
jgi:hypothetical protein